MAKFYPPILNAQSNSCQGTWGSMPFYIKNPVTAPQGIAPAVTGTPQVGTYVAGQTTPLVYGCWVVNAARTGAVWLAAPQIWNPKFSSNGTSPGTLTYINPVSPATVGTFTIIPPTVGSLIPTSTPTWWNQASIIIPFSMPSMNDTTTIRNGHVQVSIKKASNNAPVVDVPESPDKQVIYFPAAVDGRTRTDGSQGGYWLRDLGGGEWQIEIPYKAFCEIAGDAKGPKVDNKYSIQIRFGDTPLWTPQDANGSGWPTTDTQFANWRAAQVAQSTFGEWSNTTSIYAYGYYTASVGYDFYDFAPTVTFNYQTQFNDPIASLNLIYSYKLFNGAIKRGNIVFSGDLNNQNPFIFKAQIPIAPLDIIDIAVSAVTTNDTLIGEFNAAAIMTDIPPIDQSPSNISVPVNNANGMISNLVLEGEENNDGVLSKKIIVSGTIPAGGVSPFAVPTGYTLASTTLSKLNIYRINLITLETIKLQEIPQPTTGWTGGELKDYTVEMGEPFQYVVGLIYRYRYTKSGSSDINYFGLRRLLSPLWVTPVPTPGDYDNPYGRLDRMDNAFLTTKDHQLRLEGNVNVSQFQTVVQDQIQTTLGGKYPFYNRSAANKYRTMSLTALISINFDPTAVFLTFNANTGVDRTIFVNAFRVLDHIYNSTYRTNIYNAGGINGWLVGVVTDGATIPTYQTTLTFASETVAKQTARNCLATLEQGMKGYVQGFYWNDERVIPADRIFGEVELSLSRVRTMDDLSHLIEQFRTSVSGSNPNSGYYNNSARFKRGAASKFGDYMQKSYQQNYTTERTDDMVYIERKFRDKVMDWLTDGKPKLFRSETEGNMIVMLTGVSFAPFDKSGRMVYTMSATATEIAEYNLSNLILYNLVPTSFKSYLNLHSDYDFVSWGVVAKPYAINTTYKIDDIITYQGQDYQVITQFTTTATVNATTWATHKNYVKNLPWYSEGTTDPWI